MGVHQVSTYSGYDLCHHGLHTDKQTHRQLLTDYTISSASWPLKLYDRLLVHVIS